MAGGLAQLYCLDASACALRSEDYTATTRWHFQRELVTVHSGAAARQPSAGVALVAAAAGRASVALHPTTDAEALQAALHEVQPDGEASLEAALKLALLVSRRFPVGRTHVTAFVASAGAAASLAQHPAAATELRQRYAEASVSLDVAVLCTREELGAGCTTALAALAGGDAAAASGASSNEDANTVPATSSATRLLWLSPVDTAAESWQQLEPALEQLENVARRSSSAVASCGSSTGGGGISSGGGSSEQSAVPRRINRAPRQYPRTSLLAARSRVQQPALCRGESLSRFGHLSSDGMARPWLPTYASLGQAAKSAAAAAAAGAGSTPEMCYVEVQPLPRWRTLLKVAAGRMLAAPAAGSRPGSGNYASASSELLRSLEALNVLDDEPEGSPSSHGGQAGSSKDGDSSIGSDAGSDAGGSGGAPAAAAAAPAAVRYVPDSARGTLRLLQGTKEPHLFRLVWSAERSHSRSAPADAAPSATQEATPQQPQPLDMFSSAAGSGSGSSSASSARGAHLAYMPAATAAASAARGPIVREGCELWEAAAEFDWELSLPTAQSGGSTGASTGVSAGTSSTSGILPGAFEARQLPNGAQLLMVTANSHSSGSTFSRASLQGPKPAAAFWLQQHLGPDSLQVPAYGTAAPSSVPSGEEVAGDAAAPSDAQTELAQPPQAEEEEAGEAATRSAALLASALQRMLQQPPAVDLRRLRKDVKSGAIQVTPITVGPLPAQFVRDIVGARSALMSSLGMENLDSWGEGVSDAPGEGTQPSTGTSSGASKADASREPAASGSNEQGDKGPAAKPGAVSLQQHRSAVLSLLRQRLSRLPSGKSSGGSSSARETPAASVEPAAADEGADAPAAAAGEDASTPPKAARPCSPPMSTPAPPTASSCSSSVADTPFGTPMNILPSCLVHPSGNSALTEAAAGSDGEAAAAAPAGAGPDHGLPSEGGQLLDAKQDGPVLVAAPSQGEPRDHNEQTLFQIE